MKFLLFIVVVLFPLHITNQCVTALSSRSSSIGGVVAAPTTASTISTSHCPNNNAAAASHSSSIAPVRRVPWCIVGGGIHGVHVATRLLAASATAKRNAGGTSATTTTTTTDDSEEDDGRGDLLIIDSANALLSNWKMRTAATGMEYLRSSSGYHLDVSEDSLRKFAAVAATPSSSSKKNTRSKRRRGKPKAMVALKSSPLVLFSKDYERPRLDLFNQHCDAVVDQYQLDQPQHFLQGTVLQLDAHDDHVQVHVAVTTNGTAAVTTEQQQQQTNEAMVHEVVLADHVVLALGNDEPLYPAWVTPALVDSGIVQHLFNTNTTYHQNNTSTVGNDNNTTNSHGSNHYHYRSKRIAIVGGGISAGHKALQLVQQQQRGSSLSTSTKTTTTPVVHLISRHAMAEQQFDTHQDWMVDLAAAERSVRGGGSGLPQRQKDFRSTTSWRERRKIISRERIPGTVTAAVHRGKEGLQYAIQQNLVQWVEAQVATVTIHSANNKTCALLQLCSGETIEVDQILLATGFGKRLPSVLVKNCGVDDAVTPLPVSDFCGFPIVDESLRWGHSRIFVTGALAELELGPSARNIAGARLAAERILRASRGMPYQDYNF